MSINWAAFTPLSAAIGGALIGLSAVIYLLGNGRIAGIAGIVGTTLQDVQRRKLDAARIGFLGGLLLTPWLWSLFATLPAGKLDVSWLGLISAGLLVGIGVRMGNGCTSGHGVCGLSRLSLRSLVNVLVFMGTAMVVVVLMRHVI